MIEINDKFLENRPLSYSSLKHFIKSPKQYIQYLTEEKKTPSEQMIIGAAVDCLLLQPNLFEKKFKLYEKPNLRSNAGKEEWQIILDEAKKNKQTLITQDQYIIAKTSRDAVLSNDDTKNLIENKTKVQVPLKWTDPVGKLPMIGYVDFETKAWYTDIICDLKTTTDADPDEFIKQTVKMYYHLQMAMYLRGYERKQFRFPEFIFLAVETKEPFNVSINFCDSKFKEQAKNELLGALRAFRYCMDHTKFDEGYEFRLMENMNYFSMRMPGYYRPKYTGFDED